MLKLLVCLCIGCIPMTLSAQESYRVMFYNVENLFDTHDDPDTDDDEFTPLSKKHWTADKYRKKLLATAQVIDSVGGGVYPTIVGFAEVENRRVLKDLTEETALADAGYGIVHRDSPDGRGIDVAMLYRKAYFVLLQESFIRIDFPGEEEVKTRDVLYAKGVLGGRDTLHFFVCHFPSMVGGEMQSEWKRERAAIVLKATVDSVLAINERAGICIMGDLNGKANTSAIKGTLMAMNSDKKVRISGLYNTGYYLLRETHGSYRYQGNWQTIDHIIVSGALLKKGHGFQASRRLTVYEASFLLEEDRKFFGYKPYPTYRGPRYIGGYSDHLPVYIDFQ